MIRSLRLRPLHVGLLIPWLVAVVAARRPLRDNSFLWHVRAGTAQIDAGEVLTADPFSFTFQGTPWRTQSWLLELAYGWLDERVGLAFVPWFVGGVSLLILLLIQWSALRRNGGLVAAVLLGAAGGWLGAAYLNPRPVLVSYLFLLLVMTVCAHQRLRWTLPLIAWVWAAVHASFVLGIAYVFLDGLRRNRVRLGVRDAVLMGPPLLLTAHGLGVVEFLIGFASTSGALEYLTEWATPDLLSLPFLLVVPSVVLVMVGLARGDLGLRDLWLAGPALALMVSASRSVFPGWLFLVPLLARVGARREDRPPSESRPVDRVAVPVLALAVAVLPLVVPADGGLDRTRFPVEAMAAVTEERVYADDVAGGWLVYEFWPDRQVFVDDRAEVYGAEFFEDVLTTRAGTPAWSRVFEEWGITQAIVHADDGLATALDDAGWRQVHEDDEFLVFTDG